MMQKVPITELALVARDAAELLRGPSALAGGDAAFLALSRLRRIDGPFSHIAFSNETSQLMDAIVTSLNTYPDAWETRNLGRCAEELTRFAKLAGLRQQQIRFFESTKVRRAMRHLTLAFVPRVSKVLPAPLAGICGALARAQIRYEPIFKSVGGWLVAVDNVHRGFGPKDFNMGVFLTSKPPEEGEIAAAALQYDVLGKSIVKDKQFGSSSSASASTSSRSDSDHRLLVERALFTEKEGEDGEYSECEKTVSDWVGSQWPGIVDRFWKRSDEAGVFRELALGKQQQRQSYQRSPLQGTPTPVLLNLLWAFSKTKMPVEQYGPIYAVLLRRLLLVECGNTWDRHALQGFAAEARFSSEGINHGSSSSSEDQSLHSKTSISDWRNRDAAEVLPVRTSLLASSLAALSSIPIDKRLLGPIGEASWLTAVRRRSRVGKAQQISTPTPGFAGPTGAALALEEASLPQLKALATSLALKQLSASSEFAAPRHAAVAARVVISLGVADTVEGSAALSLIVDRARTLLSPQEVPDQHSFISAFSPGELAPTLSALGALVRASAPSRSSQRLRKIKQSTQLDRLLKSDAHILSFLLLFSSSIRVSSLDEFRRVDAVSTIASAAAAAEDEDIDGDGSLSVVIDALPSSAVEETTDREGRLIAYGDSTSGSGSGSEGSEMRRFLRRQQRAASIHSPQIPTSDLSANGGCGPLHPSLIEQIRLLFTLSKECVMGNVGRISAQQFVHLVCSHAAMCMPLTPLTLHVCNLIQSRPEWTHGLSNENLVDLAWGLSCSVGNEGADAAATFRSHSIVGGGGGDKANSLEGVSHRRTLASKRVGNTSVPVVILPRDVLLSTNLAVDTNETQGRASKRSLLLEERRISHEANSIGFGLSAVKKNSPRGALCAIADRLMSTSASSLTPSEVSTLAWSLSIAGVYHCGLFDAIAKSLLSPSATVSKEEKTHSSHSVGSKTLQQQYQDDVIGLSSWTTQNLEQLGVAASFLAVRQFPVLDEELRNQDSAYKWKEQLIQIVMAVNDELKQRSSSPFILVNNNDDNEEEEEEEEEEEDRISDVEAVAEAVTFPEFNQATGASTIIRVTSLLLQKSVSKPVIIDGVESESIGDRLMCSILDDNDDKGGDTASKQMNDPLFLQLRQKLSFIRKDDEVEGDIRLHKQIEDVLLAYFDSKSEVSEQEKKSSSINATSSKPSIFHHYQALGGSIVIPIAIPSKKIAIYFEEIPDYVDSLLPEPLTSAYQKWSTNAIQLAGWTVISFGKTAFLGASGLTGKVRILEVGGLKNSV